MAKTIQDVLTKFGVDLTLVRTTGKHYVYRLPGGTNFIRPNTPSDWRTRQNSVRDLLRAIRQDRSRRPEFYGTVGDESMPSIITTETPVKKTVPVVTVSTQEPTTSQIDGYAERARHLKAQAEREIAAIDRELATLSAEKSKLEESRLAKAAALRRIDGFLEIYDLAMEELRTIQSALQEPQPEPEATTDWRWRGSEREMLYNLLPRDRTLAYSEVREIIAKSDSVWARKPWKLIRKALYAIEKKGLIEIGGGLINVPGKSVSKR